MIKLKFLGGGYIQDVPARDLNEEEAKQYAEIIADQEKLTGMKLYEEAPAPASAPARRAKASGDGADESA